MVLLLLLFACSGNGPVTHTVTLDLDGGRLPEGYEETIIVADGELLTDLPTPRKGSSSLYGYSFRGWYTDEARTKEFNEDSPITSDLTLYAKWSRYYVDTAKSYTVTFDLNYPENISGLTASSVEAQKVDEGGKATEPTDPTLTYKTFEFSFDGWYKDAECSTSFDFDNTVITEDTTVYAKWTPFMAYDEASLLEWKTALETDPSINCAIIADIELTNGWDPISNFSGTLDGNNYTISKLDDTFIYANQGTIRNAGFNVVITISDAVSTVQLGAIAPINYNQIINCQVSGTITVTADEPTIQIGGISAINSKEIIACHSDVTINATSTSDGGSVTIGGITSVNMEGKIAASYFTGSIEGTASMVGVGGIAMQNAGTISACYSTGELPASANMIGGIAGVSTAGSVTTSYWSGDTANGVGQGDGSGATQVDSSWEEPMSEMNTALSGNSIAYEYVSGSGDVPLVIQPTA